MSECTADELAEALALYRSFTPKQQRLLLEMTREVSTADSTEAAIAIMDRYRPALKEAGKPA